MQEWLSRERPLLGAEGIERLQKASVAVFGLGGVGSYIAEALARAGVGRLVLVDGDVFVESNLNRQLGALRSTLGRNKAEVVRERVLDINPDCRVEAHTEFYRADSDAAWFQNFDFVADAIDDVAAKVALIRNCAEQNIPIISAMGCGNKLDPSRFQIADLKKTHTCPLCRIMRRELKAHGIEHVPVVFSDEPPIPPCESAPEGETVPTRSVSFVPSVAGLMMAGEIICRIAEVKR